VGTSTSTASVAISLLTVKPGNAHGLIIVSLALDRGLSATLGRRGAIVSTLAEEVWLTPRAHLLLLLNLIKAVLKFVHRHIGLSKLFSQRLVLFITPLAFSFQ